MRLVLQLGSTLALGVDFRVGLVHALLRLHSSGRRCKEEAPGLIVAVLSHFREVPPGDLKVGPKLEVAAMAMAAGLAEEGSLNRLCDGLLKLVVVKIFGVVLALPDDSFKVLPLVWFPGIPYDTVEVADHSAYAAMDPSPVFLVILWGLGANLASGSIP